MNDLQVTVVRKRGIKQKFHVLIENAGNHHVLFASENYRDLDYAQHLGRSFAEMLGAEFEDKT